MELHTLGVGSGYTQADVTEFARAITGWSVSGPNSEAGALGAFDFKPSWHEPGARKILGKTYSEAGVGQGRAVLDDLARHPATAKHIATKLVRHFVADDPPPDLVATLAEKFQDGDGDLSVVVSALVSDDRAWAPQRSKVRTPLEFVVAAARATGFQPHDPGLYLQALNLMGMPLWQPAGPNGFSDVGNSWASPEGMKARLDIAWAMGQRMRGAAEPLAALKTALGETASPDTVETIQRANRASRRWRSSSWRRSSRGDDHGPRLSRLVPVTPRLRARGRRVRGLAGFGFLPMPASAAGARDPRFVVIILRGAMDGLSAVPPIGDPDYAALHGDLAFSASGDRAALPLESGFGLHPSLAAFKGLYDAKQATIVHAVATGYRDRSHFDGQDVLESGNPGPGRTDSGWLNRTLAALPAAPKGAMRGVGVGATAPLVIRGPAPALGWTPPGGLAPAGADLTQRVLDLYAHRDPLLGERLRAAVAAEKVAAEQTPPAR